MAHFSVLLNSGEHLLLNSGSNVLLNAQPSEVHIVGKHSSQMAVVKPRRPSIAHYSFWIKATLLFHVCYRFNIIAYLVMKFERHLELLLKPSIYTENVRKSFVLELSSLREKLKPFKEELKLRLLESDLENPIFRFSLLLDAIKRSIHGR